MSGPVDLSSFLTIAVRTWTTEPAPDQQQKGARRRRRGKRRAPKLPTLTKHALVIDTETTVDSAQGLLFGAFRYCRIDGTTVTTVAEGLIYADDLPTRDPAGFARLQAYARGHKADVDMTYLAVEPNWDLELLSRSEFVTRWLWRVGYRHDNRPEPALVVMFNAPFDLSRLAVGTAEARGDITAASPSSSGPTRTASRRPGGPG